MPYILIILLHIYFLPLPLQFILLLIASVYGFFKGYDLISKLLVQNNQKPPVSQAKDQTAPQPVREGEKRVVEDDSYISDVDEEKRVDARIQFDYFDGIGFPSSRVVKVQYYRSDNNNGIFLGFCELRNAERCFRFDRVSNPIEKSSGDEIKDLILYFESKFQASSRSVKT